MRSISTRFVQLAACAAFVAAGVPLAADHHANAGQPCGLANNHPQQLLRLRTEGKPDAEMTFSKAGEKIIIIDHTGVPDDLGAAASSRLIARWLD